MTEGLSLCIINRDDRDSLVRLVKEARPWVDEIVIVDTGSSDGSAAAALSAGADVIVARPDLLHEDGIIRSFADARNAAFDLASQPWRMSLDVDDTLDDSWKQLPGIVELAERERRSKPSPTIRLRYDYATSADGAHRLVLERDRLTHRDDGWHWVMPVHEQLRCDRIWTPITLDQPHVRHLRQDALRDGDVCRNRNLTILKRWETVGEPNPDYAQELWYQLGEEMYAREQYDEAFTYYDRMAGVETPRRASGALRAGRCLRMQGKMRQMVEYYERFLQTRSDIANFYWEVAYAYYQVKNPRDAAMVLTRGSKANTLIPDESTYPRDYVIEWLNLNTNP